MAYDEELAPRIRDVVQDEPGLTESLVSEPRVGPFEMRGREMDGWLRVDAGALETDDELRRRVSHGVTYARSLPPRA